jgi:hypothetical protein
MTAIGVSEAWAALALWAMVFAGMLAQPVTARPRSLRPGAR